MATITRITLAYPAVFTPEEEGGFSVTFPDLDGCITEGDDLEDARRNAQEALTGYLESIFTRGIVIPEPSKVPGKNVHLVKPAVHVAIPLMVRKARLGAGLSQVQLAERIGVSYQAYQRVENPRSGNISLRTLEKVCQALDCELDISLSGSH